MRLILHIGGAKCGSSAIQSYLRNGHEALARDQRVLIPGQKLTLDSEMKGEQIFFFEYVRKHEDGVGIVNRRLRRLHHHMRDKGLDTLIVSAENLINPGGFEKFFVSARDLFEVEVVLYIRRQDQYFISAWQQWHLKTFDTVQDYIAKRLGHDANWNRFLAPWEALFGREAISVRRFQRDHLIGQDIVTDFVDTAGLPGLLPDFKTNLANRSFSEHLGEIANRVRDVFDGPHDNGFYDVMVRLIGESAYKAGSGSMVLTLDERQQILDAYEADNRKLKERYFSDLGDEPLFDAPKASEEVRLSEEEKRKAEIDLLARGLYNLAKQTHRNGGAASDG